MSYVGAPIWPTDPDLVANRVAMVAAEEGWCEAYTVASFRAWCLEGVELGSRAHLRHVPLGQAVDHVIAKADDARAHERLKAETDAARCHGNFGSPASSWMAKRYGGTTGSKRRLRGPLADMNCRFES
ncbi:hypothetical protein AB4Z43_33270 [Mesorhizobium sp. 2RAF45]|uniref:hypothetical protein n=1 Tax=Mesorhizobium sp. 2RAF45 TaxID=3233001 RepID=UPI003F979AD6